MENLQAVTSAQVKSVLSLYDAFGRGDVPFIIEHVDPNFTWNRPQ